MSADVRVGADWLHEIKHDGFRLMVRRDGGRVRLYPRGHDWVALRELPQRSRFQHIGSRPVIEWQDAKTFDGVLDGRAAERQKKSASSDATDAQLPDVSH